MFVLICNHPNLGDYPVLDWCRSSLLPWLRQAGVRLLTISVLIFALMLIYGFKSSIKIHPRGINESVITDPFPIVDVAHIGVAPDKDNNLFLLCFPKFSNLIFQQYMFAQENLISIKGSAAGHWMRRVLGSNKGSIRERKI